MRNRKGFVIILVLAILLLLAMLVYAEEVTIPFGKEPLIDGRIEKSEWGDAVKKDLETPTHLQEQMAKVRFYFKHSQKHLFVALESPDPSYVDIFLENDKDDTVYQLHSSAALGDAIYKHDKDKSQWVREKEFEFEDFHKKIEEKKDKGRSHDEACELTVQEFEKTNGWRANFSEDQMLNVTQFEFKIAYSKIGIDPSKIKAGRLETIPVIKFAVCINGSNDIIIWPPKAKLNPTHPKFNLDDWCEISSSDKWLVPAEDDGAKINSFIEDLANDEVQIREKATDELINLGEKAKKFVEEALKETNDPEVKARCEIILKTIHLRSLVGDEVYKKMPDKIKSFVISTDIIERLKILKEIRDDEKISDDKLVLIGCLISKDVSKLRREDIKFIIEFIETNKLKSASKILVELLEDKGEIEVREGQLQLMQVVRQLVSKALGNLGAKEYAKDIAKLLEDQDAYVRAEAASVLGILGTQEYAKDIAKLLEDQNPFARWAAVIALGELTAKEYAKEIMKLLKDADSSVRIFAMVALIRFGEHKYLDDIMKLLEDQNVNVRYDAACALAKLRKKETLEPLKKALEKEQNIPVAIAIRDAIKKIESQK